MGVQLSKPAPETQRHSQKSEPPTSCHNHQEAQPTTHPNPTQASNQIIASTNSLADQSPSPSPIAKKTPTPKQAATRSLHITHLKHQPDAPLPRRPEAATQAKLIPRTKPFHLRPERHPSTVPPARFFPLSLAPLHGRSPHSPAGST